MNVLPSSEPGQAQTAIAREVSQRGARIYTWKSSLGSCHDWETRTWALGISATEQAQVFLIYLESKSLILWKIRRKCVLLGQLACFLTLDACCLGSSVLLRVPTCCLANRPCCLGSNVLLGDFGTVAGATPCRRENDEAACSVRSSMQFTTRAPEEETKTTRTLPVNYVLLQLQRAASAFLRRHGVGALTARK